MIQLAQTAPRKRRNPPATHCMEFKNGEWRVLHGNKILARYANQFEADDHMARLGYRTLTAAR